MNTRITAIIFLAALVGILFAANSLLSPRRPDVEKVTPYECGFVPLTQENAQTRQPFNVIYYLVGVLFLLLDLEIAILFPLIVTLGQDNAHLYGLTIAILFLALLTAGFVFEYGKGALHITEQRAALNRSTIQGA